MENQESVSKDSPNEEKFRLPELSDSNRQKIRERLPEARQDIARLEGHYENLKKNYPDVFADLAKKHPSLSKNIERVRGIADFIGADNPRVSNEEIFQALDDYNFLAQQVNSLLGKVKRDQEEQGEGGMGLADMGVDESEYTEAQKAELKAFAQDLWRELFPESNVDKFVRWTQSQRKLEGYQKILLAPANGIEGVLGGLISLFKPKTYMDLYASIKTAYNMDEADFNNLLKGMRYAYDQLSTTDKIAPVVELISGCAFVIGGIGKLGQVAQKLGYSPTVVSIFSGGVRGARAMGKVAPMAAMTGIMLPYIKVK